MSVYLTPSDANLLISDITTNDVSTSAHGFAPKSWASAWTSWTPTWTGFSANPTTIAYYQIMGKTAIVVVRCTANGTSNATTTTITNAPATSANRNASMFWFAPGSIVDNGTAGVSPGRIYIGNNTTTIQMDVNWSGVGWTASGAKAASFTLIYETA